MNVTAVYHMFYTVYTVLPFMSQLFVLNCDFIFFNCCHFVHFCLLAIVANHVEKCNEHFDQLS
jgi:hypothetical protein